MCISSCNANSSTRWYNCKGNSTLYWMSNISSTFTSNSNSN